MEVKVYKAYRPRRVKEDIIKELKNKNWMKEAECVQNKEYIECVYDILADHTFQKMEQFIQHGTTTTLSHCIQVSYVSYKICKAYGLDYRAAARGGLLHDLFLYDWHTHCKETGNHFHGFTHPQVALHNAKHVFDLTEKEKDIIVKHMWPLTVIPPKYPEGYVVMYVDKYCGLIETVERMKSSMKKMFYRKDMA